MKVVFNGSKKAYQYNYTKCINLIEQCEWIVKLIDDGSYEECEELYKLIEDDSDKTKLFKSLLSIMVDTTNNHKNFETTSTVINEIYPIWIKELRTKRNNYKKYEHFKNKPN